jgi:ribulose-bisphosphate carboxylase large chain
MNRPSQPEHGPERIGARYRLHVPPALAAERARALALEQSIEMPAEGVMDQRVLDAVVAQVTRVEAQADGSSIAEIALSQESVGGDPGQLMNMLFGNSSLLPDVELIDVSLPAALTAHFGGPRRGVAGLRRLTGVQQRPLTCTALKPIGSTPAHLAALCTTFARAGLDVIKDDHGWSDQASAPFERRVPQNQRAVDAVNAARIDGLTTLYAPSLYGHYGQMQAQIALARQCNVKMLLIAPMVCGVATFHALVREHSDLAFLAHPSLAGARMAPVALLGRLFRALGADAVIFPNHGGRFSYSRATCEALANALRGPWNALAPALPVPAGGMSVERVPELKRDYGRDVMLLIGGSLLIARERLYERSLQFVQAVAEAA